MLFLNFLESEADLYSSVNESDSVESDIEEPVGEQWSTESKREDAIGKIRSKINILLLEKYRFLRHRC